jgi:hypothetical protein
MSNRDDEDRRIALPPVDVDPARAERIRRRAQRVLDDERRAMGSPVGGLVRLWTRALEPALVTALAGSYLLWAIHALNNLR